MNNLWENSNIQANCLICNNDSPFIMPLKRTDLVALRFQIPYQNVINNGGGVPIGANVSLSLTDEIGNNICTIGAANSGKFILGVTNDATNYIAEYQIYAPVPFKDEIGVYYSHYYLDVTKGDIVFIPSLDVNFIYGVDQLPSSLIEVKPGRIVRAGDPITINVTDNATINGTPATQVLLYSSTTNCDFENFDCFRYRLRVSFTTLGSAEIYYTKPFRIERCTESIHLEAQYPSDTIDCNGYKHTSSFNISNIVDSNRLFIRIPADMEREPNEIKKSYNSKCYNFKAEKIKRHRMKSDPMPEWMVDEVENILMAQTISVENLPVLIEDASNIFQNSDINGQNYQNIDLPLSQCKCENVFVC
jgi:hypothetical protein